jgi:hypothetical protein
MNDIKEGLLHNRGVGLNLVSAGQEKIKTEIVSYSGIKRREQRDP